MIAPAKPRIRPRGRIPALLLACLFAGISPAAPGAVIEVDILGDVTAADGDCALREAIDNANDDAQTHADCEAGVDGGGDTIRFAQTQALFDAVSDDQSLELSGGELIVNDAGATPGESLTIEGAIADPSSSDDPPPEVTVTIDGGGDSDDENVNTCVTQDSRVGRIFAMDTPATLTSLTLTNACIEDLDGGLVTNASALTLTGVDLTNGHALGTTTGGRGGAVFNAAGGTLTIDEGSRISLNFAARRGGGIANVSTTTITGGCPAAVVADCTISLDTANLANNIAGLDDTGEGGSGTLLIGYGAGLHNDGGTVAGRSVTVTENTATVSGGGIWNAATGTVALLNATVQSNRAFGLEETDVVRGGGAIFNDGGTVDVEFAAISGNQVRHGVSVGDLPVLLHGGGIAGTGGTIVLDTVAMTQNQVGRAASQTQPTEEGEDPQDLPAIPGRGGALFVGGGTLTISDSTLIQNSAQSEGGAIWSGAGTPGDAEPALVLTRSTVQGNQVRDGDDGGGGLFNAGSAGIDDSRFYANATGGGNGAGGAILNAGGSLDIADTEIGRNDAAFGAGIDNAGTLSLLRVFLGATQTESRNVASGNGGGLHNRGGAGATVDDSTIAFNDAVNGGGIWNAGTLNVTNSTFSNDRSTNGGSGGSLLQGGGDATLRFTTVAGGSVAIANGAAKVTAESSLITNAAGDSVDADGFSLIDQGGGLRNLQLFGGVTPTRPLRSNSPALEAGNTGDCPGTDQRGATRPFNADCDTGSFERTDDPVLKVERNGPERISVRSQIGGDLAVLAFSITNDGGNSITVGGFNAQPLFNGGVEALRRLVRNDPEVAGQLQFDIVLDDGAGENAGNGLLDDDETTVVGTGDTTGREFLFDGGAGRAFGAGADEDFLVVLRLPEAESQTAGLLSTPPILAGGFLIGVLGLVRLRGLHRRVQWLLVIGLLTAGLTACSESTSIDDIEPPPPPNPDPSLQGQIRFKLFQLESTVAGEIVIGDGLPVFGPAINVQ